jgi:hypothetical protein
MYYQKIIINTLVMWTNAMNGQRNCLYQRQWQLSELYQNAAACLKVNKPQTNMENNYYELRKNLYTTSRTP